MAYTKQVVEQKAETEKVVRTEGERVVEAAPRKRIPFGVARTKLDVPYKPEGFHLHWVNDAAGRVYAAQQGGYEFVSPQEVGLETTTEGEDKVKILVGKTDNNQPLFAYLMKIKQDWYDEDQTAINEKQDMFDEAIKRGTAGKNELGVAGYTPRGVNNSVSNTLSRHRK